MRSLEALGSTIFSMIKFPTNQGIVTMETIREALCECRQLERVQGTWKKVQWRQREEQMSRIREQVILRTKNSSGQGPNSGPVSLEKTWDMEDTEEVFTISHERPDQKLKRVNIKIDLTTSSFGVKEFLGHMVIEEGLKADLEKIQAIILSPTPRSPNEIRSLLLQLTAITKFIPKLAELKHPIKKERDNKFCATDREGRNLDTCFLLLKKFFGQGEQVGRTLDAKKEGTLTLSKKLQEKSTPTLRAWRLYLGKETIEEGSGIGIILVSPEEKTHSYVTRLKFNASNHAMDYEALLAGLAASANQDMKDLHVFIDSLTLVAQVEGNHTPATEQERKYKEEIIDATALFYRVGNYKARIPQPGSIDKYQNKTIGSNNKKGKEASNALGAKPNYNQEASGSN
ncbi:reverse transcriptase domain-containing protein [Tanacetum coccineum]